MIRRIGSSYNLYQEHAMPLRDHFRPPVSKRSSWEGFHGGWTPMIVRELALRLPDNFVAEPRVHLGSHYEINATLHQHKDRATPLNSARELKGGVATATEAP